MIDTILQSKFLDPVLGSERCEKCGARKKVVPGYGDPLTGHKMKYRYPDEECREVTA